MQVLHYTRAQQLPGILAQRIAILDGAMGTMIQRFKLGEESLEGVPLHSPLLDPILLGEILHRLDEPLGVYVLLVEDV